ncbi:hypothetical protein SDRG_13628 [Saprolegnia diclina VS20]|uniref:Palmitoyltransferase n=1 Tax=Saprolegnia diclina (strain VS20) TaxID=1156394 RepID=T0Q558_SAPDV|nr:hypothetical protein SDRG_13628 [Saprolegnia diclina VS20]EQC28550.1 hypothetical protein SDRG_13628 [Saprolegnia diclina VS20]|eukprot:XP_008617947.1 hypothetical protein SDRG_13628 [Saprolegnia diclina VS20]
MSGLHYGQWPTHHPASLGVRHHSTTSYSSLDDKAVVCKKNVFVSKSMRVQLARVSYINMILIAQTLLFNAYRGEAITHSATCERYNTVRLLLRSVLWGTSFVLFLPTTGHKFFKLYHVRYDRASRRKRHRLSDTLLDTDTSSQPPSRKQLHVVRTTFLRLCECVALAQIALLALTIVYIPLGMAQPSWTWDCPSAMDETLHGLLLGISFVFALWAYIVTWDFLVMFHQLRTHLLLQHGVFGDAHLAHDRPFNRSRTEILRHRMWMAVQEKDMEALHAAVTKALGEDPAFATNWFSGVTLRCHKRVASSQHNPLHLALKTHQHEIACYLLDVGFGLNTLEKVQLSEFALRHVYDKVFCFFSPNFEEPPSLYGPRGWFKHTLMTPLHVAVVRSDVPMVQKLLAAGADPNVPAQSTLPTYATPPLFWATHPDVTKLLLEHGANQLHVPKHGFYLTAYEDALLHGRHAIAHLMETWGADIALTPLHDAAAQGDPDLLLPFLSDESVNTLGEQSKGLFRRTPLHWAAIRGQVDTARVLLQHGATINAVDAYGRTPLAWACYLNHVELAEELVTLWDAKLNSVDHLAIGFQESLDHLFAVLPWIHAATSEDADSLVDDAPMLEYHMHNLVL